ncbi:MAG TPA: hypothetical protein VL098_14240 [Flavipsychrobacter sp.]|nr:hypothetical protein [Flavipsychrobacter sp.]
MLEQLNQLIRQFGQQAVVDNNEVPNEHNEGVMQEAQSAIFAGLQNMVANGQTQQLTDMLQSGASVDQNNPMVQGIANNFLGGITEKFGISKQTATQIAAMLIPMVLSQLTKRTSDTNDNGFNLPDILGSLVGGGAKQQSGGGSAISQLGKSFLDKDKDGDVDLNDVIGMVR